MAYVQRFEDLDRKSVATAGGKGANLGEMARAGLPVPPGFVVTVEAFDRFASEAGIATEFDERLRSVDLEDSQSLASTAQALRQRIERAVLHLLIERVSPTRVERNTYQVDAHLTECGPATLGATAPMALRASTLSRGRRARAWDASASPG